MSSEWGGFTGAGASLLNFELETVLRFTAGNGLRFGIGVRVSRTNVQAWDYEGKSNILT